jgi:hypothetical protein
LLQRQRADGGKKSTHYTEKEEGEDNLRVGQARCSSDVKKHMARLYAHSVQRWRFMHAENLNQDTNNLEMNSLRDVILTLE